MNKIQIDKFDEVSCFDAGGCSNNPIRVWVVNLDYLEDGILFFEEQLSPLELARASKYNLENKKIRFIIRRAILKILIGDYLNISPKKVLFRTNSYGKLSVSNNLGLEFSLSASGTMGIFAISSNQRVGIDIEKVNNFGEIEYIVNRFFTKEELHIYNALGSRERLEMFFKVWTRKEAYIKAIGKGLFVPLDQVNTVNSKMLQKSPNQAYFALEDKSTWLFKDLQLGPDYQAALVAEGDMTNMALYRINNLQEISAEWVIA